MSDLFFPLSESSSVLRCLFLVFFPLGKKHVLYHLFQCESVQLMLESLGGQRGALKSQLEGLEQDVARLKEWATGLTEKRAQLQSSLTSLREAVGQIEARTSTITKDFTSKVIDDVIDVAPFLFLECKCMWVETNHIDSNSGIGI